MKLQQLFQFLEIVVLLLMKKIGERRSMTVLLRARLVDRYVHIQSEL